MTATKQSAKVLVLGGGGTTGIARAARRVLIQGKLLAESVRRFWSE